VATMNPKRMLNERKKLRQWQAAQMRTLFCPSSCECILLYPSSYERILIYPSIYEHILADKREPIFRTFEEAYRKAFREVLEESINEDPFFRAFEEALAENPDADPNAIWSLLELANPFGDPFDLFDDPDEPMPRQVFVAPAVIIRRRSCSQSSGRRSSGNGTGNGKGGGDGGNGDGDDDSNANSDNHIKINARAWTRAERR